MVPIVLTWLLQGAPKEPRLERNLPCICVRRAAWGVAAWLPRRTNCSLALLLHTDNYISSHLLALIAVPSVSKVRSAFMRDKRARITNRKLRRP